MKKFDLDKAKDGHPLITRDGNDVLEFKYFKHNKSWQCSITFTTEKYGIEFSDVYGCSIDDSSRDLFLKTMKTEYHANLFLDPLTQVVTLGNPYLSYAEALQECKEDGREYIKTISYEIEEDI
jgi:hypothetical protein